MNSASSPAISAETSRLADSGPTIALEHLDALWLQVTGTVCNLRCAHCFISCAPENDTLGFLSLESVLGWLEIARRHGVKEYYVTGGEPFMHADLPGMLEAMLRCGPVTVLTNGTLFTEPVLTRLAAAEAASDYSLELRVSIDGPSPETNDPIRGEGTFERAMEGIRKLLGHGFLPILTAARVWDPADEEMVRERFFTALRDVGCGRPRLKILPSLRIGRETLRSGGYDRHHLVTEELLASYDRAQLLCSTSRIVTSRGVHVCPILVDHPDSLLGPTLEDALRPFELRHRACFTCWHYGAICSNHGDIGRNAT
jgi:MoaA/NifB/PqqE/SkfB family radical SAM enzyme